jgi:hypothetical protein
LAVVGVTLLGNAGQCIDAVNAGPSLEADTEFSELLGTEFVKALVTLQAQ